MSVTYFKVSSITYAVKGRDLLRKYGFSAYMERDLNPKEGEGCGYKIKVLGDPVKAEGILRDNHIKIKGIYGGGKS